MRPLGDQNVHFWLAQRMAKATETDLVAATDAAHLSQQEWADLVAQCRTCEWADGCKRWLQAPHDTHDAPPNTCVNQQRFVALKSAMEALDQ